MPVSAWVMLVFGCLVLYGGLTVCLVIAWRKGQARKDDEADS
jgi:hypothetical protein